MIEDAFMQPEVAAMYGRTRPLPVQRIGRQMAKLIPRTAGVPRVVEIGCGTGRLSQCFASMSQPVKYVGLDHSEVMLARTPRWLQERPGFSFVLKDCRSGWREEGADVSVMHWVLNASPEWRRLLRTWLESARIGGLLLTFREEGDLYSAIDGRLPMGAMYPQSATGSSSFIDAMWQLVYEQLEHDPSDPRRSLATRAGLSLDGQKSQDLLAAAGLKVFEHKALRVTWQVDVSAEWMVTNVLRTRSFSNLRLRLPHCSERACSAAERFGLRFRGAYTAPYRLRFSTTPITAIKE